MPPTDEIPAPDPALPQNRSVLYGHEAAERQFASAYASGRLHHAWLVSGPKGIGKATLAYRMARHVLRHPDPQSAPQTLNLSDSDPVFRRVASRGHADLLVVEREWDERAKRFKSEIGVAGARKIAEFFTRTAGESGWRVCIVDSADEMNSSAANAILKILEEPPARALIILVSQDTPGRLLPTIRSRCLTLNLKPIADDLVARVLHEFGEQTNVDAASFPALINYARGSPGRALELVRSGGDAHLTAFSKMITGASRLNRGQMLQLAAQLGGAGKAQQYDSFCAYLKDWIMLQAHEAALGSQNTAATKSSADAWAQLYQNVDRSMKQADSLNLDRRLVMLETFQQIEQVVRRNP